MSGYTAPLKDMLFVLQELAGLDDICKLPGLEEATPDVVQTILTEAGKFAGEVLAPLNRPGDRAGARMEDGVVTTAPGFKEAYRRFVDSGWPTVPCPPEFGGQGMPQLLSIALAEMWCSSNMSFSLCPMLSQAAVEAIEKYGTDAQKAMFLAPMVSGEWTGTMNLTEPQAGSDLAATRARAVPEGDHYRISGTKIFITYGEHDFTDNIIHMVLARLPDAPEGTKGISLFIVPKFLVGADGGIGARNDLQCVSLEHKLGIHASPTAVMSYGDKGGAVGYLIGQANRGLEYMFLMMNRARLAVGLQGVAVSERAYQQALAYARERVQGRPLGASGGRATIVEHPDVRRMLMSMKAQTEAMRALAYLAAANLDTSMRHPDAKERARAQANADLLIPIVKGWSTEQGNEVASTGVQVHGGMGFIEETGAAQLYRDMRIAAIYEGTTGIQAMDLVGRKVARDAGAAAHALIADMRAACDRLKTQKGDDLGAIGAALMEAAAAVESATTYVCDNFGSDPRAVAAGSVP
ncbi:MAG TPA: acyl-CoA dehydrogenase family protein, partial [Burkholderiales bacterium]|nr:acyl-CoA dehydrogenase family protein [Burkholderiales bacterium]